MHHDSDVHVRTLLIDLAASLLVQNAHADSINSRSGGIRRTSTDCTAAEPAPTPRFYDYEGYEYLTTLEFPVDDAPGFCG